MSATAQIWESGCNICNESITNPICMHCLGTEIEQWLIEHKKDVIMSLRYFIKSIYQSPIGKETACVLCNTSMDICAHCYSKLILEWVNTECPELNEEFIRTFDFDLVKELL